MSFDGVLTGALLPLTKKMRDKNINLIKTFEPPIEIYTDEHLLEQMFYNLILNAVDASPKRADITVDASLHQNTFTCTISDQGTGMPFKPDPHTLSPGPSTKRFGTGLGIPFAFKVCEVLGGQISFDSLQPQGTRVTLTLPK